MTGASVLLLAMAACLLFLDLRYLANEELIPLMFVYAVTVAGFGH